MALMFVCGDIINYEHKNGRVCSGNFAEVIYSEMKLIILLQSMLWKYKTRKGIQYE